MIDETPEVEEKVEDAPVETEAPAEVAPLEGETCAVEDEKEKEAEEVV